MISIYIFFIYIFASPISPMFNNAYVVLTNYLYKGLKFLQVIYDSFDCDLTKEFFDSWFE